jgi:hypothetical protein
MIVEYIRYDLKTHTPEQLIDSYRRAGEHLKAPRSKHPLR